MNAMSKKNHISETPATQWLRANKVPFTEHPYDYLEHGGAQHSAHVLGFDPFEVVKTLIMQDESAKPLACRMRHLTASTSLCVWPSSTVCRASPAFKMPTR